MRVNVVVWAGQVPVNSVAVTVLSVPAVHAASAQLNQGAVEVVVEPVLFSKTITAVLAAVSTAVGKSTLATEPCTVTVAVSLQRLLLQRAVYAARSERKMAMARARHPASGAV